MSMSLLAVGLCEHDQIISDDCLAGLRLVERSSTQPLAGICQRILVNPCEALRGRSLKRSNASESERIIRQ